jgi:adenosylcobinamide-GDP ribazoletransferase
VNSLSAAFKYLTIWGCFGVVEPSARSIGKGALFFPLVGGAVGLVLALANYLLAPYLQPEILSVLLITLLIVASGGRQLEGLCRAFIDSSVETTRSEGRENISLGMAALLLVILFKIAAVDSMDEKLPLSLLLAPLLARWALVLFFYGYHTRFEEIPRLIAEQIRFWHFLVSTVATLALAVYFLGRKALWIGLTLSLFTLSIRSVFHRRHGVLVHEHVAAIVELCEALSLILLASL